MLKYVDLFDLGNKFVLVDLRGRGFKREGKGRLERRQGKKGLDKRGDQRGVGNQSLKEGGREGN